MEMSSKNRIRKRTISIMKARYDKDGNVLRKGEYQRKNGVYEFRYYLESGKLESIYEDSLKQLRVKEYNIALKETTKILTDMKNITVNDQFDMWIASKVLLRPYTLEKYEQTYDSYVRGGFGKTYVNEVNTVDVKAFYTKLMVDKRLKVETVDHVQNILFQVFAMAKETGGIINNPAEKALHGFKRSRKKNSSARKGLTKNQEKALLQFLLSHPVYGHWYMPILVLVKTGLRKGELLGLQWKDFDFESRIISVKHELTYYERNGKYQYNYTSLLKTDAAYRVLPITKEIEEALVMIQAYNREKKMSCKSVINGESNFVFLNNRGHVYDIDAINRAIKRIVIEYNKKPDKDKYGHEIILPNFSCHTLRHTYAKRLAEAGVNPKVAQKLIGHNDIRSTFDIYMDIEDDVALEEFFEKVK